MVAERLVASQRNCVSLLLSLRSDWLKCPCNFRARVFGRPPVISGPWKRQVSLSESVRCSLLGLGHDDDDLKIVRYVPAHWVAETRQVTVIDTVSSVDPQEAKLVGATVNLIIVGLLDLATRRMLVELGLHVK